MATLQKNDKKTINAWCMYDWANSVYNLVITTAIFPIYYSKVTSIEDAKGNVINDTVSFLGFDLPNSSLYSYVLSFSFIIVVVISPLLSSISDQTGSKKTFLKIFCYTGALSCALLFFFDGRETVFLGMPLFALAGIGFWGSLVFYNAYLPEIATEDRFDKISAKGYSLGYIGSVILLVINLLMITFPQYIGLDPDDTGMATKITFVTVGLWWAGFAQISFSRLPNNVYGKAKKTTSISKGYKELFKVISELSKLSLTKRYLLSFFFYSMGVQTVMLLATIFGDKVIKMEESLLILTVLIIQLIAIPGAYAFSTMSQRLGNIKALIIAIVVWACVCIAAYFITTDIEFMMLAGVVGFIMGGIQSLSRSTYAKFIPTDTTNHASYFSFYDVTEKLSIVVGTLCFGLMDQFVDMRTSALLLLSFFIIGFIFILKIPSRKIYSVKLAD